MKKTMIRILSLLLALLLWIPVGVFAEETDLAANLALDIDDSEADKLYVTLDDSVDTNAVLADAGLYLHVECPFEKAYVLDKDETPVASTLNDDGTITFAIAKGGTYTILDMTGSAINIYGANMKLGNELAMNFFLEKDVVDAYPRTDLFLRVTKTYADKRENVVREYAYGDWTVSGGYYKVTFDDISAKEMADDIFVQVFHEDGTPASDLWTDSVRAYVERALPEETQVVRTLLVDMLNYGAAAQQQFGYGLNDLANSTLTAEQQTWATQSVTMEDGRVRGQNYYGTNLNLASNISLGLFFRNVTRDMTAEVSYTNAVGEAKSFTVPGSAFIHYSGSIYRVLVNTLSVKDCGCLVTCSIKDAEGNTVATATDSVEGWVARNTTNTAINEAIMKFSVSAAAYEASKAE